MIDDKFIGVSDLCDYLDSLLAESLLLEAVYCRAAYNSAYRDDGNIQTLSTRLSAIRCARESREASLSLGRRFLGLVASLEPSPQIEQATAGDIHLAVAFGYAGGVLLLHSDETVAAFLHQSVAACLSTAQRLLPLGQIESSQLAWDLKPSIERAVHKSASLDIESVSAFSHLPELASMRHPLLATRLFIS